MKLSLIKGFCFGLTSSVITTLGMMVGLHSASGSKLIMVGGILSIAIADSFSDALGIHVAEESDHNKSEREIWAATFSTLIFKFLFSVTFLIPILFLNPGQAITVSIIWGFAILGLLSYYIGKKQGSSWQTFAEHILIALAVILITHLAGDWINRKFS